MFCTNCGKQIADGVRFCPECGSKVGTANTALQNDAERSTGTREPNAKGRVVYPKNPPLSPHLAWLALCGAGVPHIVFGQIGKGMLLILATIALLYLFPAGLFGLLVFFIVALVDAYMVGYTLKTGKPVKKWRFFPLPYIRKIGKGQLP